jgi:UDP-N-acetylmuramoylalanine--D-glutamate ligase
MARQKGDMELNIPDKVLVVGLGLTGVGVARFLHGLGKEITIVDAKSEEELAPSLRALEGIEFKGHFGPHRQEHILGHDMIVVSPGVDTELPMLKEAQNRGARVIGEMELASAHVHEPIIAITGTNGKTTVTSLLGELFTKAFGEVFVGGNIGNPLVNYVLSGKRARYIVLEVSSFQLETIERFRPDVAILLNITEDHLDRYRSFEEYRRAKHRIFENQHETDWAVLNRNLPTEKGTKARKLFFSTEEVLMEGAFSKDHGLFVRLQGKERRYQRALSPLIGIHNTENLLACLLAAHTYGIDEEVIESVVRTFRGLPHRVEPIREIGGVTFLNDSKATNVDATKRALESIDGRVILIAGGKDKGGSYTVIRPLLDKVKAMVLIGEATDRIEREVGPYVKTYRSGNLREAVMQAHRIADRGDIVLFSPMCSSFDMFRDYKDRGNQLKTIVEAL